MLNKFVAIGLGAVIALAPLAAVAQTEQLAQAAPAPDSGSRPPRPRYGSHRDTTINGGRATHHSPPERARPITCHHCAPPAPMEAPKS